MQSSDPRFGEGPDAHWLAALAAGRFLIQRCQSCRACRFPPALVCARCGAARQEWIEAGGGGTVYSATTVRAREGDYNVAIIELDEGCRLMSRVADIAPDDVAIGMRVQAHIAERGDDGTPELVFLPAEAKP